MPFLQFLCFCSSVSLISPPQHLMAPVHPALAPAATVRAQQLGCARRGWARCAFSKACDGGMYSLLLPISLAHCSFFHVSAKTKPTFTSARLRCRACGLWRAGQEWWPLGCWCQQVRNPGSCKQVAMLY